MIISAQISLYPLRQDHLGPAIEQVWLALERHGLAPQAGPMSTYVTGEHEAIFAALSDAFGRAAETGHVVLSVTVSNACSIPD
ncbi:MAG: YkoF family thiamine/hydroxymethylpyrimidine-binding protein [Acetobacteraceae bacterium]